VFWPAALGLVVGTAWVLDLLSRGWYSFYAWYVVRQTVLDAVRVRRFWTEDLLGHVSLAKMIGIGEVFIPSHSYYPALVGKPSHAHWAAITDASGLWDTNLDVQRGGKNDPRREIIMDELRAAVASQRFDAILLDDYAAERHAFWDDLLAPYYELDRRAFADANVFWTVSGSPARPQLVYVPKQL